MPSSVTSMGYLAPSGIKPKPKPPAEEPLPPQRPSWIQATVQAAQRFLLGPPPLMAPQSDLQARYAKAKDLHHGPGFSAFNRATWWRPKTQYGAHKMALGLYKDVASDFFEANQLNEAGEAFEAAAYLEKDEFDNDENVDTEPYKLFENAAQAYYEERPLDSARCQQEMIQYWMSLKNPRAAAPLQDKLGDMYMKRLGDTDKAVECWQKAGNWYKNARSTAMAIACYKKMAEASTQKGDYYKAIETYEWCADNYPGEGIMKQSQTVGFFFMAGLCHVATTDTVALSRALRKYCDMDNSFSSSREGRFLLDLSQALEDADEQKYMEICNYFDSMTRPPMPDWKKDLLVKGHLKIREAEDDFS